VKKKFLFLFFSFYSPPARPIKGEALATPPLPSLKRGLGGEGRNNYNYN